MQLIVMVLNMTINDLLEEIRQENVQVDLDDLIADIEEQENLNYLADPRFFGSDIDEGANDCAGLFYWDLK